MVQEELRAREIRLLLELAGQDTPIALTFKEGADSMVPQEVVEQGILLEGEILRETLEQRQEPQEGYWVLSSKALAILPHRVWGVKLLLLLSLCLGLLQYPAPIWGIPRYWSRQD
jgi:hypothetical protein